jgi:hypothetical protein
MANWSLSESRQMSVPLEHIGWLNFILQPIDASVIFLTKLDTKDPVHSIYCRSLFCKRVLFEPNADRVARTPRHRALAAQLPVVREQQNEPVRQRLGTLYLKPGTCGGNIGHQAIAQGRAIGPNHPRALAYRSTSTSTMLGTHALPPIRKDSPVGRVRCHWPDDFVPPINYAALTNLTSQRTAIGRCLVRVSSR